jgi:hypothetical protein
MNVLKLITEVPDLESFDYIIEEKGKDQPQNVYIRGPYLMAEKINKNKRKYKLDEMTTEIDRYIKEMVETKRSLGELNHAASIDINPERACHLVVEMKRNDNVFIGKSKITTNPMGHVVRCLIQDGVRLGTSSRALGKLTEKGDYNDVNEFHYICNDVVHDPSVDSAFVDGIFESKQWVLKENGELQEYYEKLENSLDTLPKRDVDVYIKNQVLDFLRTLRNK